VYRYADNLISDEMFESEGLRLSGWLNEYRETHREFKLEEYWEFDEEWKFTFKEWVEHTDENGKKYIEYNKEKYYEYEDWIHGLGYCWTGEHFYIWNFVEGQYSWKGIIVWPTWPKFEWEFKNGNREWKWTMTRANGNFEWDYKEDNIEKWKFTLVDPEEIAGEYEVQRDEKWLRILSWEHEGKYINDEEWKIEERVESSEDEAKFKLEEYWEFDGEWKFIFKEGVEKTDEDGKRYIEVWWKRFYKDNENGLCYMVWTSQFYIWKRENGNKVWHWVEYYNWNKQEWDYNSEGKEEWEWEITTEDGKEWWWKYENGNKVWHWIEYYGWEKREW